MSGRVVVLRGDAARLPLPDASIHAVVCDPPYALAELPVAKVAEALSAWLGGDRGYVPKTGAGGFMGRKWDDFVPPPAAWDECMRVLKPGGWMLAFAAPRTQDLMGMSIRLAGFEIRDGMKWIFGSGFPKSLDVGKAIDKRRDDTTDVDQVRAWLDTERRKAGLTLGQINQHFGHASNGGGSASSWTTNPTSRALPTWEQWGQLRELIGFGDEMDAEVWRLNGRKGQPGEAWSEREVLSESATSRRGGSWADQVNSGMFRAGDRVLQATSAASDAAKQWEGWGTALKPAHEPIVMARKPLTGTVAATIIKHGTGAINVAACRVGAEPRTNNAGGASSLQRVSRVEQGYRPTVTTSANEASDVTGRWPPNVLLSEEAAAEMDRQSGVLTSGVGAVKRASAKGGTASASIGAESRPEGTPMLCYGDSGGASRFFPVFRYEAKADASERPRLPDGTAWPTVKPVALMRWLVRLVTPPGGTVGDFFCGTGPTGEAAIIEGFNAILLDKDPQAIALTRVRLAKPIQPLMFAPEPAAGPAAPKPAASAQDSLFDDLPGVA